MSVRWQTCGFCKLNVGVQHVLNYCSAYSYFLFGGVLTTLLPSCIALSTPLNVALRIFGNLCVVINQVLLSGWAMKNACLLPDRPVTAALRWPPRCRFGRNPPPKRNRACRSRPAPGRCNRALRRLRFVPWKSQNDGGPARWEVKDGIATVNGSGNTLLGRISVTQLHRMGDAGTSQGRRAGPRQWRLYFQTAGASARFYDNKTYYHGQADRSTCSIPRW
jgi:hypothetical protein